jgi:NAD(P) transhydrogenase subunit beta
MQTAIHIMYMVASVLFIIGIKRLSAVKTARSANALSALAMLLAMAASLLEIAHRGEIGWIWVGIGVVAGSAIGAYLALTVRMEGMPELVGFFNGMGGLASSLVAVSMSVFTWLAWGEVLSVQTLADVTTVEIATLVPVAAGAVSTGAPALTPDNAITIILSVLVGGVTLTGSLVAWAKLKGVMRGGQIFLPGHQALNVVLLITALAAGAAALFVVPIGSITLLYQLLAVAVLASFILGVTFALPVGGADMPVVVSLLNSFSGIAAAMTGFVLYNNLLIISGSLVGAAGMILTIIMCRGMNRSLANVLFARFSLTGTGEKEEYINVKSGEPVDAAIALANAARVIIVPGYGLAAGQAQHAVRELQSMLEDRGVEVRYAIHEVAGRMPGHMNVLLAEANVPYDKLFKREDIEADFKNSDVALVIGANDVVNPAALSDEHCPLYGMPILPAHEAQQAFVIKRSLAAGFAGMKNTLFESDKTLMIFGSAKEVVSGIAQELKEL